MSTIAFHTMPLGEKGLLVQVDEPTSHKLLQWLLIKKELISQLDAVEVIHTYDELLIKFLDHSFFPQALQESIENILQEPISLSTQKGRAHRVPVCYDPSYGTDIEEYANALNLSISKIIELHTKPVYLIYFLGFLPGFPYLQGLDQRLSLPRKAKPSRKIPAGGVGIGGDQTGIYPQESPGGWHIIGQTPLSLFDILSKKPSPFQAGDTLEFYQVSIAEFESIIQTKNND